MRAHKFLISMVFAATLGAFSQAHATESPWAESDYIKARLITEKTALGADQSMLAALEIVMEPQWHIYWRSPGDGGLTPTLDWKKSGNLKDTKILWPAPLRFEYAGLFGFGYKDTVLLPLILTPKNKGKPLVLRMQANIMVCNNICIPQNLEFSLDLPAGTAVSDKQAAMVADAHASLPPTENRPDMKIENVVLGPKALVVSVYMARGFDGADLFAEIGSDKYLLARPQVTLDKKDPRYASLIIAAPDDIENLANEVMDKTLILTLTKDGKAIERSFKF